MPKLFTAFSCFEIDSIAVGFQLLNVLTADANVDVLEAFPLGGQRFLILTQHHDGTRAATIERLRADPQFHHVFDFASFESFPVAVLEALHSLSTQPLIESLIVLESATLSALLRMAAVAFENSASVIEVKIHRSLPGGGHAFFTAPRSAVKKIETAVHGVLQSETALCRCEYVESPTATVQSYFTFATNATNEP